MTVTLATLCTCGHPCGSHHDTGRRISYCTVWTFNTKCPCLRFEIPT